MVETVLRFLGRYRSYVVAVVAVAVVALAPSADDGNEASVAAGSGVITPDTPAAAGAGGLDTDGGTAAPGLTPVPGARTQAGRAATGAAVATPGATATAQGGYPGIGTPEALNSPLCDPETGRVRVPWSRMPRCVKPWPAGADNGGATAQGVTAKSIKIVVRLSNAAQADDAQSRREAQAAVDTVADHFELWGRKIELVFQKPSGDDEIAQRADATAIANELKPFAVLVPDPTAAWPVIESELAARGILVMSWVASWADQQKQSPLRWTTAIDDRTLSFLVGEFVGKRLAGRPAQWAGDPTMITKPRKFGVVYPEAVPFDIPAFKSVLAQHGVTDLTTVPYPAAVPSQQEHVRTAIAKLRDSGVTSVISFHELVYGVLLTTQATQDRYNPEWVMTGFANHDTYVISRFMDQTQWANAFGIGTIGVPVTGSANFTADVYQWHHGRAPEDNATLGSIATALWPLMAGMMMAGPRLTVASFRDGMFAWKPSGGQWENAVGLSNEGWSFGRANPAVPWDDYSSVDDASEKWWDATTTGTDEIGVTGPGVYWKLNGGRHYRFGGFPTGAEPTMFSTAGAIDHLDAYPAGEAPKKYPHKPPS